MSVDLRALARVRRVIRAERLGTAGPGCGYPPSVPNAADKVVDRVFALAADDEQAKSLAPALQALYQGGEWSAQAIERVAEERSAPSMEAEA